MKVIRQGILSLTVLLAALPAHGQQQMAKPEMRPGGGPIQGTSMSVTIQCSTPNATIFYTTDTKEPTPESQQYRGPITVSRPMTIRARAYRFGWTQSPIAEATYTREGAPGQVSGIVADPVVTPDSKDFRGALSFEASCATAGAEIRFTDDGSPPTRNSKLYRGRETIGVSRIIKMQAFKAGMGPSRIVERKYRRVLGPEAIPYFTVKEGSYPAGTPITLEIKSKGESGVVVRYTSNGDEPGVNSPVVTSRVMLDKTLQAKGTVVIKARSFKDGSEPSDVAKATYTFVAAAPTPAKGVVTAEERSKSAEECAKILSLQREAERIQKEIERVRKERADRRKRLGLDPDPDCRMK